MNGMSEHWTERLSDYLDGDLSPAERATCVEHLRACDDCAAVLDELRELTAAAALLPDIPPSRDLWPGIEANLTPREAGRAPGTAPSADAVPISRSRRWITMSIPQLAAAAIALVLFSVSGVYLAMSGGAGPRMPGATALTAPGPGTATPVLFTDQYDALVTDLEAEFLRRRDELDPETVRVIEQNLLIIERAISDARQALEADPSSGFLNSYVAGAMRRKVELLRQATLMQQTET
jgi:hypothetical protein